MWLFDLRSGRILAGNLAALNLYGFTQQEFSGLVAKDLLARESTEAFIADAAKPCSSFEPRGIWRHRRKDRSVLDVEVMATDLRFGDCPARLIFAEDIGPRLLRESELCEGQRMRILRRVAEGVAHHFGQILSVVEGQTTLVCEGRENPSEKEHLQQILAETRRGSALIRQLLAVGACEGIQPEPLDLNEFIRAKDGLLRRLLGERISLELRLVEGLQPALVDSRTVEHVILNLAEPSVSRPKPRGLIVLSRAKSSPSRMQNLGLMYGSRSVTTAAGCRRRFRNAFSSRSSRHVRTTGPWGWG
jgi:PAS domain S-box-containing protein